LTGTVSVYVGASTHAAARGTNMITAKLKIVCWNCGREEEVIEVVEDGTVDFNLNKLCPGCRSGWMIKKELTMRTLVH
jgi:hypothetical protein